MPQYWTSTPADAGKVLPPEDYVGRDVSLVSRVTGEQLTGRVTGVDAGPGGRPELRVLVARPGEPAYPWYRRPGQVRLLPPEGGVACS